MGYKKMKKNLGFAPVRSSGPTGQADFAIANSLKHNRSLKLMKKLHKALNWARIESVLMSHYTARPVQYLFSAGFIAA